MNEKKRLYSLLLPFHLPSEWTFKHAKKVNDTVIDVAWQICPSTESDHPFFKKSLHSAVFALRMSSNELDLWSALS